MSLKQIGIITSVKKDKQGNITGWIKSPLIGNKFFDSNSLTNEHQVTLIKKDETVFFDIKEQTTSLQEEIKIENLVLFPYILRKCFHYSIDDFKFFFENSNEKQKKQLKEKILRFEEIAPDNIDLDKIHAFKKIAFKNQEATVNHHNIINSSLIESVLSSNSSTYNQKLINSLANAIKIIDSTIVYNDVKVLLKYSQEDASTFKMIKNRFYQKCTDSFKFLMWFDGLIDYCTTNIIKRHFEEANDDLKAKIVTRCGGDECGYLVLQQNPIPIQIEAPEPPAAPQKVETAYFSGIRAKLLEELSKAKESIKVAVAWFTNDELFSLLCTKADEGVKVELIINNDFINNWLDGLPFQKFVDRDNTELYFYDHPKRMHNKFCIIDDTSLFNGSYNWTYWAEAYNDENVIYFEQNEPLISKFVQEFEKLKTVVDLVHTVIPFDRDSISIFEKRIFREYLSKDIEHKAKYTKASNVIHSNQLVDWSIEFNPKNQSAKKFKKSIQTSISFEKEVNILQEKVIQTQHHINKNEVNIEDRNDDKEHKTTEEKVSEIQNLSNINPLPSSSTIIKSTTRTHPQKKNTIDKTILKPAINASILSSKKAPKTKQKIPKSINHSIPKLRDKEYLFDNLQLVFLLDYSGSMKALYSSGKVQIVVDKISAIANALTSNQNIDVWTFNKEVNNLSKKINKKNYTNFVKKELLSRTEPNGGTFLYPPLKLIYKENFINKNKSKQQNIWIITITDGHITQQKKLLENIIVQSNTKPIFWQFIGLGKKVNFLQNLESNAEVKNINFLKLNKIRELSSDEIMEQLLVGFSKWHNQATKDGIII